MKPILATFALAALGSLPFLPTSAAAPAAVAAPGPGGVIEAVRAFLAAVDKGDETALQELVAPGPDDRISLYDLDLQATPARARGRTAFLAHAAALRGKGVSVRHEIADIQADCPSAEVSYATVDFDRVVSRGDDVKRVPMRATVLVRFRSKVPEGSKIHFQLFHWHASPASR